MSKPHISTNAEPSLWEVSAALFTLRDALAELSLALKDWQFEADDQRRQVAATSVQQLLKNIASRTDPA